MTMRLIDELLKDDFFNGGYRPPSASLARGGTKPDRPGKRPLLLVALIGGILVVALGAGAWFYLGQQNTIQPPSQIVADAATGAPATQEPIEPLPAAPAAPATVPDAQDAPPAEAVESPAASPAATPQAEQPAAPAQQPQAYALAFQPFSDRNEVNAIADRMRGQGLTASISESTSEVTRYAVVGRDPVDEDEANAIRLKASVLDLTVEFRPMGDGQFTYTLGRFDDIDRAREVGASAHGVDIPVRLGRFQAEIQHYHLEVGGYTDRQVAERQVQTLANEGIQAQLKHVAP